MFFARLSTRSLVPTAHRKPKERIPYHLHHHLLRRRHPLPQRPPVILPNPDHRPAPRNPRPRRHDPRTPPAPPRDAPSTAATAPHSPPASPTPPPPRPPPPHSSPKPPPPADPPPAPPSTPSSKPAHQSSPSPETLPDTAGPHRPNRHPIESRSRLRELAPVPDRSITAPSSTVVVAPSPESSASTVTLNATSTLVGPTCASAGLSPSGPPNCELVTTSTFPART